MFVKDAAECLALSSVLCPLFILWKHPEYALQAVAQFLRTHAADLDKSAMGEYFGHHEDFEVSVMHAWIDMERYSGLPLDSALRALLAQFRLPGEAQKIDRIMEKVSQCNSSPGGLHLVCAGHAVHRVT